MNAHETDESQVAQQYSVKIVLGKMVTRNDSQEKLQRKNYPRGIAKAEKGP
jgi:hypothetical protein